MIGPGGTYTMSERKRRHVEGAGSRAQRGWTDRYPTTSDSSGGCPVSQVSLTGVVSGINFGNLPGQHRRHEVQRPERSGVQNPNDPGLFGWRIYVDYNNDGVFESATEPSAVTGPGGTYTIIGVATGTWKVREVGQGGWTESYPTTSDSFGDYQSVTVLSNGVVSGINFGNWTPGGIIGVKFNDLNGNRGEGSQRAGSGRVDGLCGLQQRRRVRERHGAVGGDRPGGTYTIIGVAPGTWKVREVGRSGWTKSYPTTSDSFGDYQSITVSSGGALTGVDFGNHQHSVIAVAMGKSPNTPQFVSVIDEDTGAVLSRFAPYGNAFQGGVRIATGDLTGDGVDESLRLRDGARLR